MEHRGTPPKDRPAPTPVNRLGPFFKRQHKYHLARPPPYQRPCRAVARRGHRMLPSMTAFQEEQHLMYTTLAPSTCRPPIDFRSPTP